MGQVIHAPSRGLMERHRRSSLRREIASFWLQFITLAFGVLGGGFGLFQYYDTHRKERVTEIQELYDRVDEKYSEFIAVCMEYPHLDCYSTPALQPVAPQDQLQQKLLYTQLINVFEVTFLRYTNISYSAVLDRSAQWEGWIIYMDRFAVRPSFRTVWHEVKDEFDPSFAACLSEVVRKAELRQDFVTAPSVGALGPEVHRACRL